MQNHAISDYLGEKKMFAEGPEFWHVGFVSPEKHCSEVFFAGLLFVFEILRMQTTLSFPSGIFWRSIVKRKQKKPFVSLKDQVTQSFLTAGSLAQVDNAPNRADSNLFCRDTRGLNLRSVKSFFFCSVFLLSKTVFVSLCLCN